MKRNYLNLTTLPEPLTVDVKELASMLRCGTVTAKSIAESCGAAVRIPGTRRVFYNVRKVREYIDRLSAGPIKTDE